MLGLESLRRFTTTMNGLVLTLAGRPVLTDDGFVIEAEILSQRPKPTDPRVIKRRKAKAQRDARKSARRHRV